MNVYRSIPDVAQSVITIGSFDGVHLGHQALIAKTQHLAQQLDTEEYILTFEPHPRLVIQPHVDFKILQTTPEKLEHFERLGVKNVVLIPFDIALSELTAEEFLHQIISQLHPKAVVIGYDHKFGKNRKGSMETFVQLNQSHNLSIDIQSLEEISLDDSKISSTAIRQHILHRNITQANQILGYPYTIHGKVIEGKKLGRTIGFPTANIQVDNLHKLMPPLGIYHTEISVQNQIYLAATSISTNPTISDSKEIHIESHILDFDRDIYNEGVKLSFIQYLRDEMKFDSLDELKLAIGEDIEHIHSYKASGGK